MKILKYEEILNPEKLNGDRKKTLKRANLFMTFQMGEYNMIAKTKKYIFDILDKSEQNGIVERIFDIFLLSLISLNVVATIIESSIKSPDVLAGLKIFEVFSIITFSIEYMLRLWVSDFYHPEYPHWKARLKYAISGMAIIDLLAILPFYLPFLIKVDLRALRILRLFRLMRILKLNRYTESMMTILRVVRKKSSELISAIIVVLVLMVVAASLMYSVESVAQPEVFASMGDALWWAVATLTTVGYGDIYPITLLGKLLASLIALLGIGIVAIPTGIIVNGFAEMSHKKTVLCPYCGKEIEQ